MSTRHTLCVVSATRTAPTAIQRRALAAGLVVIATVLGSGCAQPAAEAEVYEPLTPSATPVLGVAAADLRTGDLAHEVTTDLRIPEEVRGILPECPTCLGAPTWHDVTGDGREDAVVTITDGVQPYAQIIFTVRDGRTVPAFIHVGHHASLVVEASDLVLTRAMYAPSDPEDKPSGTPLVSRFRWNEGRFVQTSRVGGSPGTTPNDVEDKVIL